MKDDNNPVQVDQRTYPSAAEGVSDSKKHVLTEQTRSPTYELAFADDEFLLREEMRGVRLQLEFEKPEFYHKKQGIESTLVVFGSARLMEESKARTLVDETQAAVSLTPGDADKVAAAKVARRMLANAKYYDEARELARIASTSCMRSEQCHFVVSTGGGPGIMEAANRGAHDVGAKSIGLNIVLPDEQEPNPYISPELCFQFHYFALRKMHFLLRAKALVYFPGGFGTMDELFGALTLIETGKMKPLPVILVGRDYWEKAIDLEFFVAEGLISAEEARIVRIVETGQEAWQQITEFYSI
ncbi:MAG: hypothetical protein ACI8XO_003238 [Verrucomicrobiales bacterium]|jgi:uncharacterized protein (TIGR00730 family)